MVEGVKGRGEKPTSTGVLDPVCATGRESVGAWERFMGQGGSNLDGLSQKQLRRGISKTEALAGEAESFLIELAPLPRYQLLNLDRPLLPQVVAGGLFKFQQG